MLQILIGGGVIAQEVQLHNFCPDCDRDLSTPISGLVVKTKLIPYCKPSGSSCTLVDSFDVQYKENTCPQKPPNQWVSADDKCSNDPSETPLVIKVFYPYNHDYSIYSR